MPKFVRRQSPGFGRRRQMPNQIQNSNEMPKRVRHDQNVILNLFQNPILDFDIHLTFVSLPCLPQAGTGRDFDI